MAEYKLPGEHTYDGITLSKYFPAKVIEELKTLDLRDGDIMLDAYPKSGRFDL